MSIAMAIVMLLVFAVSALATHRLARAGPRRWLLDHPNERSLHQRPTTRSGGLAITLGILLGGIGTGILTATFLVALMLVFAGFGIDALSLPGMRWQLLPWLAIVVTCLYVAWLINLYNFMDGMDGFAGGMAVFGFGTFALLGALHGHTVFAGLSGVVAAAAGGYLLFNFPPARIFMGDAGSSLLGFLAAGLSLWASVEEIFPLWVAVLVFSPFIVDATVTLGRRLWRRERVWEAHKSHCYQRLVQLGWGHRKTVLWEYLLMLLCSVSAVVALTIGPTQQWWLLISWIIVYVILIALVNWLEARVRSHGTVESL
jgi:UDP-N-acetylmuramyl pentapeptide phosphotransferase/UDP-N-acetylglucosamine-1-phosphate transferase